MENRKPFFAKENKLQYTTQYLFVNSLFNTVVEMIFILFEVFLFLKKNFHFQFFNNIVIEKEQ